jgi:SprT protein
MNSKLPRNTDFSFESENPVLHDKILNAVKSAFKELNKITKINLSSKDYSIVYFSNSKLGGYVWPERYPNKIFINSVLFGKNVNSYLNEIVPHEVCHIFQEKMVIETHHGETWKYLMRSIGLQPRVCHNLDTKGVTKTFKYICSCKKHFVSTVLHKRMSAGNRYYCRECKKYLVFLG